MSYPPHDQIKNKVQLSELGLSLQVKPASSKPQNETEAYVEFIKQAIGNFPDIPDVTK